MDNPGTNRTAVWRRQIQYALHPTFWLACGLILVLDLGLKYCMTNTLSMHLNGSQYLELSKRFPTTDLSVASGTSDRLALLGPGGHWLRFKLSLNQHFAFSKGPHQAAGGLVWHFLLVFFYFLVYLLEARAQGRPESNLGFSLLIGGGLANAIDRLFFKSILTGDWSLWRPPGPALRGVTDFIDLVWFGWSSAADYPGLGWLRFERWPAFNLADALIFTGLVLLVYHYGRVYVWPSLHLQWLSLRTTIQRL